MVALVCRRHGGLGRVGWSDFEESDGERRCESKKDPVQRKEGNGCRTQQSV